MSTPPNPTAASSPSSSEARSSEKTEPERERHRAQDVHGDTEAARVANISPEGAPADPVLPSSGIVLLIGCSIAAVLLASLLTGLFVSAAAGWGVFAVSMLMAVVVNPVIYASVLRARERKVALDD